LELNLEPDIGDAQVAEDAMTSHVVNGGERTFSNVWFLDDGTLVGALEDLLRAITIIQSEGPQQGFHLAPLKTSLLGGALDP
jgi:hypothetical protein